MSKIDPLPNEPLYSPRIINEEDGRDFEFVVDLGLPFKGIIFTNPVPVFGADGKTIGYSSLFEDQGRMNAIFFVDYHTPERLALDNRERYRVIVHSTKNQINKLELSFDGVKNSD